MGKKGTSITPCLKGDKRETCYFYIYSREFEKEGKFNARGGSFGFFYGMGGSPSLPPPLPAIAAAPLFRRPVALYRGRPAGPAGSAAALRGHPLLPHPLPLLVALPLLVVLLLLPATVVLVVAVAAPRSLAAIVVVTLAAAAAVLPVVVVVVVRRIRFPVREETSKGVNDLSSE